VEEVAVGAAARGARVGVWRVGYLGKEDERSGFMIGVKEIEANKA
jgi:hypothetical protein